MQISSFKTILAAGISLFVLSCHHKDKKKTTVQEITLQDITQEEEKPEPPPPPPPKEPSSKVKMQDVEKQCYANDGLKYATVITIYSAVNGNTVDGNVSSEDLGSGKKETAEFTGTRDGDKITVKFRGNAPVIGDASEWTNKPWIIKKAEGKSSTTETLHIIFNAKNYDTNKWKDTEYLFPLVDCK